MNSRNGFNNSNSNNEIVLSFASLSVRNSHFRCFLWCSIVLSALISWLSHSSPLDYLWHITVSSINGGIVVEMRKNLKSGMDSFEWAEINEINGINGMKFAWTASKCMFNEMQPDRHRFTARCQRIASRCDQQETPANIENQHSKRGVFFLLFLSLFSL